MKEIIDRAAKLNPGRQKAVLGCVGVKTQGIDLSVPYPRLSSLYSTSGKTAVQWEKDLHGRPTFVKWEYFVAIVRETWVNVYNLPVMRFLSVPRSSTPEEDC